MPTNRIAKFFQQDANMTTQTIPPENHELRAETAWCIHGTEIPQAYWAPRPGVAKVGNSQQGRVAVVDIMGTMTKHGSYWSPAGSTIAMRQHIDAMAKSKDIGSIILRIDSPGGTVAGTVELAEAVAAAAKKKHVIAYVEDLAASAAYWVASQADEIVANANTARIGSIGAMAGFYDRSVQYQQEGIQPVLIRTGEHKGAGIPGTKITDPQIAHWQRLVDGIANKFTADVAKGRKLPMAKAKELADGRVHLAPEAQKLGLIDRIEDFDSVVARLQQAPEKRPAATLAEYKAACPGADADFLIGLVEAEATTTEACAAWIAEQNARLTAATRARELAELNLSPPRKLY